jgi:hypothetical protein
MGGGWKTRHELRSDEFMERRWVFQNYEFCLCHYYVLGDYYVHQCLLNPGSYTKIVIQKGNVFV